MEEERGGDHVSDISLRLRHPTQDVGGILEGWGFEVGRSWVAGTARFTPKGTALKGIWPDSYAYVKLETAGISLAEHLRSSLAIVEPFGDQIAAFSSKDGRAELFVGWFFERNSGELVDWQLMERLSRCRLSLSLDIYPEPQRQIEEVGNA